MLPCYATAAATAIATVYGVRKRQRLSGTAKRQRKNGNGMVETGHNTSIYEVRMRQRDMTLLLSSDCHPCVELKRRPYRKSALFLLLQAIGQLREGVSVSMLCVCIVR